MAKESSKRVMKQRNRDYDRVSILLKKKEKYLFQAQALREGVSVSEMVRRAVLARCGLENMPRVDAKAYSHITEANTQQSAKAGIRTLQNRELTAPKEKTRKENETYYTLYISGDQIRRETLKALRLMIESVTEAKPCQETPIDLQKADLMTIYRLLSNIEENRVYPDPGEEETAGN